MRTELEGYLDEVRRFLQALGEPTTFLKRAPARGPPSWASRALRRIISDKIGPRGLPMVIENGGSKAVEADSLGRGKVVGHFRAL